jgi:hypothetical protein
MLEKRKDESASTQPVKRRRLKQSIVQHQTDEPLLELVSLPVEILLLIFCFLDPASIINLKLVNHYFHSLSNDNAIWKNKISELGYTFFEFNPNLSELSPHNSGKVHNYCFENEFMSHWRTILDTDFPDQSIRMETKTKIYKIFELIYETSEIEQIINAIQTLDQNERESCRIHCYLSLWFKYAVKKGLIEVVSFLYHHTNNIERLSLFSLSARFFDHAATELGRPDYYTLYDHSPLGVAIFYNQVAMFELLLELKGLNYYQINEDIIPGNCIEVALDLLHFAVSRRKMSCMPALIQACIQYRNSEIECLDPEYLLMHSLLQSNDLLRKNSHIFDLFLSTGFYRINDEFLNFIFLNHSEEEYTEVYFSLLGLINQWQISSWNDELKITDKLKYFRKLTFEYDNVAAYCALQKFLGIDPHKTKSDTLLLALKKYATEGCIDIFQKLCDHHHKENPRFLDELGIENYCRLVHETIYNYLASSVSKMPEYSPVDSLLTSWPDNHEAEYADLAKHDTEEKRKFLRKDLIQHLCGHRGDTIDALLKLNNAINLNQFTDHKGNTLLHQVWYLFESDLNGAASSKYYRICLFVLLELGITDQKNNLGYSVAEIANESFNKMLAKATDGLEMKRREESGRTYFFQSEQNTSSTMITFPVQDNYWDDNDNNHYPGPSNS